MANTIPKKTMNKMQELMMLMSPSQDPVYRKSLWTRELMTRKQRYGGVPEVSDGADGV